MKRSKVFPGHLITFEGGEGAGKSTLILRLQAFLVEKGFDVIVTREPGGTALGESIRELLLSQQSQNRSIGDLAELLLFLAARAQHIQELILPALQAGKIVLCDRFNDSSIAYQGGGRGLGVEKVKALCALSCGGAQPTATFLLDVPPELGLLRTASLGEVDRIESEHLEFHRRVRGVYLDMAREEPMRFVCLDGAGTLEEVFAAALRGIEKIMSIEGAK